MPRLISERKNAIPALAEVFREHGFEGASLSLIGERTGLGKGSLYHFFPGGKGEIAAAVLAEIDDWFEQALFRPLQGGMYPRRAIRVMIEGVGAYFRSGRRVCLLGAFALGDVRDRFATAIRDYFAVWIEALTQALVRSGLADGLARARAEEAVAAIQGALVLARALDDPEIFRRLL